MTQTEYCNSPKQGTAKLSKYTPRHIQPGLSGTRHTTTTPPEYDVVIIGAGLGGLAASIFLRQVSLRVLCIEPKPFPHACVGESLDWSAPGLLQALGLSRDRLIEEQVGTYKRNIKIVALNEPEFCGQPDEWFRNKPLEFEIVTLHVDRAQLDQRLFEMAQALGVIFI